MIVFSPEGNPISVRKFGKEFEKLKEADFEAETFFEFAEPFFGKDSPGLEEISLES